ncbi:MAG TPA: hypothetical protein VM070_07145 [Candidatus Saccharimonadales bacterium]|nr:hypothetical protein [Candidatus Saccharimonadales bacterium]
MYCRARSLSDTRRTRAVSRSRRRLSESIRKEKWARFTEIHRGGTIEHWLKAWQKTIDRGPEAVMDSLTSKDPESIELRGLDRVARRGVLETGDEVQVPVIGE